MQYADRMLSSYDYLSVPRMQSQGRVIRRFILRLWKYEVTLLEGQPKHEGTAKKQKPALEFYLRSKKYVLFVL